MTLIALAEPNRLRIVELLRDSPSCSVGEITNRLHLRQPQVSKHLRALNEAGIVRVRPLARQRIYDLNAKPLEDLGSWIGSFRSLWARTFRRLPDAEERGLTDAAIEED